MDHELKVALAQISPVWLNKQKTLEKVASAIEDAAKAQCDLVVFGEGLIPGYPFWLALTGGAEWDKKVNKVLHAHYVTNAICIEQNGINRHYCVCCRESCHHIGILIGNIGISAIVKSQIVRMQHARSILW